jgi:FkbM family methyltransferase
MKRYPLLRAIVMFFPKLAFYSLKSFFEIFGFTLELLSKYYPKYSISLPKNSLRIPLSTPMGNYSINPLSHDFILRFGLLSDYLIDIGANRGNFTDHFFRSTKSNRALLIEPIPNLANSLRTKYKDNKNVTIIEKALSDDKRKSLFYVANNDGQSSSLSDIGERHLIASPDTNIVNSFELESQTLDNITSNINYEKIFLKIDVQGHELAVLKGATESLKKVIAIHIEVSNQHLYDNDTLGFNVWSFLNDHGFILYGIDPWFRDIHHNGELIQADFFFIKSGYLWENFFNK